MIAPNLASKLPDDQRIVITGVGLTSPNGNDWATFRQALLEKRSGVQPYEIRYFGETLAGVCDFDAKKYQSKKDIRRLKKLSLIPGWIGKTSTRIESGSTSA